MLDRWLLRHTLQEFSRSGDHKAVIIATQRAFSDSAYERRLAHVLEAQHARTPAHRAFTLNYSCWLDALGRNREVIPLLETSLSLLPPDPQLACQLAWAIAEVAPIEQFAQAERWLAIAEELPALAVNITDTRAWMLFRTHAYDQAFDLLAGLPDGAEAIPEVAYHMAAIAAQRDDEATALFYLEHALRLGFPFAGIYDAMRLQATLLHGRAPEREPQEVQMSIPPIDKFHADDRGLVVSLANGHVLSLTWDRIWELADATPEQRRACRLTADRLGLVWPEFKLALTSLHLREAAMSGLAPPQDRRLHGMYPQSWHAKGDDGPLGGRE